MHQLEDASDRVDLPKLSVNVICDELDRPIKPCCKTDIVRHMVTDDFLQLLLWFLAELLRRTQVKTSFVNRQGPAYDN